MPRQYSTGGKHRLFGISKGGNVCLLCMLIHGARALLLPIKYDTGRFGPWVQRLAQRAPHNKVVVAIEFRLLGLGCGREKRFHPEIGLP